MSDGKIYAPWTQAQADNLNAWQNDGRVHPFTCECGENLFAIRDGWICFKCDYTQKWAHAFLVEPRAVDNLLFGTPGHPQESSRRAPNREVSK